MCSLRQLSITEQYARRPVRGYTDTEAKREARASRRTRPGRVEAVIETVAPAADARPIVFLNVFGGATIGGGELVLLQMIEAAQSAGFDVVLVCLPEAEIGRRAAGVGARVIETELLPPAIVWRLPSLRRMLAELSPAAVHGTGFLTNALARWAAPAGATVIETVQVLPGASRLDGRSRVSAWVRRVVERSRRDRTDLVIAVSAAVRDAVVASGVPADRVRVVHPGVAVPGMGAEDRAGSAWPEERSAGAEEQPAGSVPVTAGRPTVGMLARLEPVKGAEHFVAAAVRLRSAGVDAAFVVGGDGGQRARLEAMGAAAGVTFVGHVADAPGFLSELDIVVVPSLSEAFGLVAVEASLLGKPVVASNVGGLREIVDHGVTGLLVSPGDPEALADAIERLLGDPAGADAMGAAGRASALDRFGIERTRSELAALYGGLRR